MGNPSIEGCECDACTNDTKSCPECEVVTEESGIRCGQCHHWYHYLCSGLKITTIMLFEFDTEASWLCLPCQKREDPDFDERFEKVKSEIVKEKELIARSTNTTDKRLKATLDANKQKKAQEKKDVPKKDDTNSKYKTKLCRFYAYNRCAKKDDECQFIHPPTCKKALGKKPCYNSKCDLFHFRHELENKGGNKKQGNSKRKGNGKPKKPQNGQRKHFLDTLQGAILSLQKLALTM